MKKIRIGNIEYTELESDNDILLTALGNGGDYSGCLGCDRKKGNVGYCSKCSTSGVPYLIKKLK